MPAMSQILGHNGPGICQTAKNLEVRSIGLPRETKNGVEASLPGNHSAEAGETAVEGWRLFTLA